MAVQRLCDAARPPSRDGPMVSSALLGDRGYDCFDDLRVAGALRQERDGRELQSLTDQFAFRIAGENYSHSLSTTSEPVQEIRFAKENGSVQALYRWGSEAVVGCGDNASACDLNSSYFTTGNGMMLHSQIAIDNRTSQVDYDSVIGLVESGFVGSMTDWIREYSWPITLIGGAILGLALLSVLRWKKRRPTREKEDNSETS